MQRFLTSIRLDPKQMEGLSKISARDRRTTAWLIREAVDQFLKRDAKRSAEMTEPIGEGFVIKMTHRLHSGVMYVGAVPVDYQDANALEREGLRVVDFENTFFETFEEASEFPFPTAEVAASMLLMYPATKNINYEVVPTQPESATVPAQTGLAS